MLMACAKAAVISGNETLWNIAGIAYIGPGAYAILDISEITDAEIFKQLLPKAIASVTSAGGQYIVRTDKIAPLSGTPSVRASSTRLPRDRKRGVRSLLRA